MTANPNPRNTVPSRRSNNSMQVTVSLRVEQIVPGAPVKTPATASIPGVASVGAYDVTSLAVAQQNGVSHCVAVLDQDLIDRMGNVIYPEGTKVTMIEFPKSDQDARQIANFSKPVGNQAFIGIGSIIAATVYITPNSADPVFIAQRVLNVSNARAASIPYDADFNPVPSEEGAAGVMPTCRTLAGFVRVGPPYHSQPRDGTPARTTQYATIIPPTGSRAISPEGFEFGQGVDPAEIRAFTISTLAGFIAEAQEGVHNFANAGVNLRLFRRNADPAIFANRINVEIAPRFEALLDEAGKPLLDEAGNPQRALQTPEQAVTRAFEHWEREAAKEQEAPDGGTYYSNLLDAVMSPGHWVALADQTFSARMIGDLVEGNEKREREKPSLPCMLGEEHGFVSGRGVLNMRCVPVWESNNQRVEGDFDARGSAIVVDPATGMKALGAFPEGARLALNPGVFIGFSTAVGSSFDSIECQEGVIRELEEHKPLAKAKSNALKVTPELAGSPALYPTDIPIHATAITCDKTGTLGIYATQIAKEIKASEDDYMKRVQSLRNSYAALENAQSNEQTQARQPDHRPANSQPGGRAPSP